jgi:hypothetical protein
MPPGKKEEVDVDSVAAVFVALVLVVGAAAAITVLLIIVAAEEEYRVRCVGCRADGMAASLSLLIVNGSRYSGFLLLLATPSLTQE